MIFTPPRFTEWNLKMLVCWKRNLLFRGLIFRLHFKLQGCICSYSWKLVNYLKKQLGMNKSCSLIYLGYPWIYSWLLIPLHQISATKTCHGSIGGASVGSIGNWEQWRFLVATAGEFDKQTSLQYMIQIAKVPELKQTFDLHKCSSWICSKQLKQYVMFCCQVFFEGQIEVENMVRQSLQVVAKVHDVPEPRVTFCNCSLAGHWEELSSFGITETLWFTICYTDHCRRYPFGGSPDSCSTWI